jgi:hypothetical protein
MLRTLRVQREVAAFPPIGAAYDGSRVAFPEK